MVSAVAAPLGREVPTRQRRAWLEKRAGGVGQQLLPKVECDAIPREEDTADDAEVRQPAAAVAAMVTSNLIERPKNVLTKNAIC